MARSSRFRTLRVPLAIVALAVAPAVGEARGQTVDDLGWMAGHWVGEAFDGRIEEAWFAPAGRALSGSFRLVQDDVAIMYELLLLEQDEDGDVYYRFKHIGRGWQPRETQPLEYRLASLEGRKATFRPTSDEPPRGAPAWFTYESPTPDRLVVTIYGGASPIVLDMKRP